MIHLTGHLAPLIAAMVLHAHHRNCTLSAVSLDTPSPMDCGYVATLETAI